jgi:protein-arginine deiminase
VAARGHTDSYVSERAKRIVRRTWLGGAVLALAGLGCGVEGPKGGGFGVGGGGMSSGAVVTSVDAVSTGGGGDVDASSTGSVGGGGGGVVGGAFDVLPAKLVAAADTDRDGDIDADDLEGRSQFTWKRGALLLANVDDDDADGKADAVDLEATGKDVADLAVLRVELGSEVLANAARVTVEAVAGADHVHLFQVVDGAMVDLPESLEPAASIELAIEAKRFAGPDWNGQVRLVFRALDDASTSIASDEVALRVAPMLLLPSATAPMALHVAKGAYANAGFLADLGAAASKAGTSLLAPYATTKWQEMWMQDTVEIGYTQLPGKPPMHVALRANRGHDSYAATLLGPDMGYLVVGAPRTTTGGDAWVDWYGNLEASPPVPGWPLGRIYYGHNTVTGMKLHPDVVAFFEAQELQAPFWVDTSWLTIKHVDEIFTFVLDPQQKPKLLVVSPREAGKLYPSYYGPYNKGLQAKIDTTLDGGTYTVGGKPLVYEGVLKLLGLTKADVVELPLFYTSGHSDWSNPVNGVFLGGGVYAAGETNIYDAERKVTADRLANLGLTVQWIDDAVYQNNLGNVHCATNATRSLAVPDFTAVLPIAP